MASTNQPVHLMLVLRRFAPRRSFKQSDRDHWAESLSPTSNGRTFPRTRSPGSWLTVLRARRHWRTGSRTLRLIRTSYLSISRALNFSLYLLRTSRFVSERQVIDISGDGIWRA